jgi:Zn-dependent protease
MFLGSIDLLLNDPGAFTVRLLLLAIALLMAITVHEFSHAFVAYRLGDSTAKRLGRLTLNPRAHLDPMGTVMVLLAGFGWGKPVPVNTAYLHAGRQGMALVALAGPMANVLLAGLLALPFRLGTTELPNSNVMPSLASPDLTIWLPWVLFYALFINVILAVFNMLPISPLDGSQVLGGVAPRSMLPSLHRLQLYGPVVLMVVIMSDIAFGTGILGRVFGPVINWATASLLG